LSVYINKLAHQSNKYTHITVSKTVSLCRYRLPVADYSRRYVAW